MKRPTARADLDLVELVRGPARGDHEVFARLALALAAARLVYIRESCYTREGARYLGVPFRRWG